MSDEVDRELKRRGQWRFRNTLHRPNRKLRKTRDSRYLAKKRSANRRRHVGAGAKQHVNVVRIFGRHYCEEYLYLALELCHGTLDEQSGSASLSRFGKKIR